MLKSKYFSYYFYNIVFTWDFSMVSLLETDHGEVPRKDNNLTERQAYSIRTEQGDRKVGQADIRAHRGQL